MLYFISFKNANQCHKQILLKTFYSNTEWFIEIEVGLLLLAWYLWERFRNV